MCIRFCRSQVSVNPEYKIPEVTYTNNAAVCSMFYSETFVKIHDCVVQNPWRGMSRLFTSWLFEHAHYYYYYYVFFSLSSVRRKISKNKKVRTYQYVKSVCLFIVIDVCSGCVLFYHKRDVTFYYHYYYYYFIIPRSYTTRFIIRIVKRIKT